jgi:hypothetical protein
MCWLDILWQTIIKNFTNQLQNSKALFLSHKTSLAHKRQKNQTSLQDRNIISFATMKWKKEDKKKRLKNTIQVNLS